MAGFKIPSHRVISENISGSTNASEREKFKLLINKLEHGDVLVVTKLDRLGRNATDIVNTISKLTDMGVRVNVLQMGGIDMTSNAGKLHLRILGAIAEFEKELISERVNIGIKKAKAQGKKLGRPRKFSEGQEAQIMERINRGESIYSIAKAMKSSRQNIMRVRERNHDNQ